jgi:RNA polymerase primary sigma factor
MSIDPVRLHLRLTNNGLRQRREEAGWSQKDLALAAGVGLSTVQGYEAIRRQPRDPAGSWKSGALAIADAFGVPPEEIWPPIVQAIHRPAFSVTVDEETLSLYALRERERLADPSPEDGAMRTQLGDHIDRLLSGMPPRIAGIIRLRFGLGGEREHTLDEIARTQGVQRERIRQIEAKGLRMLRHPFLSRRLKGHL